MSYANLVNQASASNAETFQRIRDFVCKRNGTYDYSASGIGWTLHDSSYAVNEDTLTANDWVVFKSVGESGKHNLYFKLTYKSSAMDLVGYLYWNNSTHAGVRATGTHSSNINTPGGATTFWLYGDLDAVILSYTNGASRFLAMFGTIKDGEAFYDNTIATSVGSVSAGSNVVVTLDYVPVAVPAGAKVYLWDDSSCEICTVVSKDATTVTLATVGTSKAAGCRLAGDQCYFVNSQINAGYLASVSNRTTGTAAGAPQHTLNAGLFSVLADVEILNSKRIAEPVAVGNANGVYGALPHLKTTNNSGATHGNTYTDTDGTAYRVLVASSDAYLIREV